MSHATPRPTIKSMLKLVLEHQVFMIALTSIIILNAVTLGIETRNDLSMGQRTWLKSIDFAILCLFSAELLAKLYVYGWRFFRSGWNWFDGFIVAVSWVPAGGALSVMRALRVLRVLRLLSVVPQLRRVVIAIGHSIPGMASVVGILCLIFYVASVLATKLFGAHSDPNMQEWFGSISASAYTLFQIMTLESWSMGVVRPTMEIFPLSWIFFLPFIIITSFAVLNFFIGIVVDSMQIAHKLEAEANGIIEPDPASQEDIQQVLAKLERIQSQLNELRSQSDRK